MAKSTPRAVNWDLLRSLAMFFVVVVHTSQMLGPVHGFETGVVIQRFAFLCDPVFFVLSGYFGLKVSKRSLKDYYLNKVSTIILPLVIYSILLYLFTTRLAGMTLNGYLGYFASLLYGGWWFIPALIPCLAVAPFLAKWFEGLSDKMAIALAGVFAALFAWGALCGLFGWLFEKTGFQTLVTLAGLGTYLVPPSVLSGSASYFQFFLLGGVFRRLQPLIDRKQGTILILVGMGCWAADIVCSELGAPVYDPSYYWLFASFGMMVLFSRIDIKGTIAGKAISWVAQRSYSIYLLQYTTIAIFSTMVYEESVFGFVGDMPGLYRIALWLVVTVGAYLLALLVASIVDPVLLTKLQALFKRVFYKPTTPTK